MLLFKLNVKQKLNGKLYCEEKDLLVRILHITFLVYNLYDNVLFLCMQLFIVVDVYAGWAGPCSSMISILKRVKVEVNDDKLWLAIVRKI